MLLTLMKSWAVGVMHIMLIHVLENVTKFCLVHINLYRKNVLIIWYFRRGVFL